MQVRPPQFSANLIFSPEINRAIEACYTPERTLSEIPEEKRKNFSFSKVRQTLCELLNLSPKTPEPALSTVKTTDFGPDSNPNYFSELKQSVQKDFEESGIRGDYNDDVTLTVHYGKTVDDSLGSDSREKPYILLQTPGRSDILQTSGAQFNQPIFCYSPTLIRHAKDRLKEIGEEFLTNTKKHSYFNS